MDDPPRAGRPESFEERLRAARDRAGLDGKDAAAGGMGASPWGLGLRAGLEVASALAVGVGIGLALDWWLGTRPLFLVLFLFLGGAAGVLNVHRLMLGRSTRGSNADRGK
ncbi:AtpZ/AtpI family protein [Elioraea thermophila]|uniref:AtpZ/AtpI family protein n=1 Tax=Elioraea thermophila TaxID=2185104 RepID=UPI001E607283|nr:AtpZ/AtpI family protein [Elioraea thermophila]